MRRHIILTQGRSGSNFLTNTLNLHPAVVNYGEVLGDWTMPRKLFRIFRFAGEPNREFLEKLFSSRMFFYGAQICSAFAHLKKKKPVNFKRRSKVASLGFKEFGIHFQKFNLEDFLTENPDIAVIYLYRENLLQRYISLQSLRRRNIVSAEKAPVALGKMHIDIEHLLTGLDVLKKESEYERTLLDSLQKNPVLYIRYEDAFSSTASLQEMANQIFEFLGVPPIEQISSHRKILPTSLKDSIDNYAELHSALESTEYFKCLT